MAFDDLSVRLGKLKALEGETLKRHSANTLLGLSPTDPEMATEAEDQVRLDLIDSTNRYLHDSTYSNSTGLLDALEAADTNNMIERLMAIKFLELFFADQTLEGDQSSKKAAFYESKYESERIKVANVLLASLDEPKIPNRVRFSR